MKKRRPTGDSAKGGKAAAALARAKEANRPMLPKYGADYQRWLQESTDEVKSLSRRHVRGF